LCDCQFGFRRNHSTCLALINVIGGIYQHIDNRDKVLGIYLDLQKAFDSIDHDVLERWAALVENMVHGYFKYYSGPDRKPIGVCV